MWCLSDRAQNGVADQRSFQSSIYPIIFPRNEMNQVCLYMLNNYTFLGKVFVVVNERKSSSLFQSLWMWRMRESCVCVLEKDRIAKRWLGTWPAGWLSPADDPGSSGSWWAMSRYNLRKKDKKVETWPLGSGVSMTSHLLFMVNTETRKAGDRLALFKLFKTYNTFAFVIGQHIVWKEKKYEFNSDGLSIEGYNKWCLPL